MSRIKTFQSRLENLKLRKAIAEAAAAGARLDPYEAALYVGKSRGYLAILRCNGAGPKFHLDGEKIFYLKEDLDAYSSTCVKRKVVSPNVGRPTGSGNKARRTR